MGRYWVGLTMALNWDDDGSVRLSRQLARRALSYVYPRRARRRPPPLATVQKDTR
jgi:hypothetical protein